MASKLTALDELTEIDDDDIVYIVDDPGGSPASKKATIVNLAEKIINNMTEQQKIELIAIYG